LYLLDDVSLEGHELGEVEDALAHKCCRLANSATPSVPQSHL
jgi:hypothetical protein